MFYQLVYARCQNDDPGDPPAVFQRAYADHLLDCGAREACEGNDEAGVDYIAKRPVYQEEMYRLLKEICTENGV